jgi:LacI family transcriptional regulator
MLETIQAMVAQTRYALHVDYMDEDLNEVLRAVQLTREKKPLGILFLGGNSRNFQADFDKIDIPCVLVTNTASHLDFPNLSSVATDDAEAAHRAIDALVELGHRRFAIVGGDRKVSDTSRLRYEGCLASFREHGIAFDEELDYEGVRYSCQDGYNAAQKLLQSGRKFTALFAAADVMAIGAIRALYDAGLRVPEDVSVMGYDGLPLGQYLVPQLSTVGQPAELMARRAVEILLEAVEQGHEARHETVPFTMCQRESIRSLAGK